MFPVSNKAQDVVDTLVTTIERQHVTIKEEEAVSRIEVNTDQTFTVHTQNNSYESHSLVIATGGTSVSFSKLVQLVMVISSHKI